MNLQKGKKNKFKIGQKVRLSYRIVEWYASHLSWSLGSSVEDDFAYLKGEKEIPLVSMHRVYACLELFLDIKCQQAL